MPLQPYESRYRATIESPTLSEPVFIEAVEERKNRWIVGGVRIASHLWTIGGALTPDAARTAASFPAKQLGSSPGLGRFAFQALWRPYQQWMFVARDERNMCQPSKKESLLVLWATPQADQAHINEVLCRFIIEEMEKHSPIFEIKHRISRKLQTVSVRELSETILAPIRTLERERSRLNTEPSMEEIIHGRSDYRGGGCC
jgi:hypothetical protein